jgi:hypothetical protein
MGVLFSNGFAIGTNPKPMNVNVHDWILHTSTYVPAYNSGWITIPNHNNSTNLNDFNLVPTDPNIGLYINISNSAGFEQLGNLIGLVGNYTRVSFTWGTSDFVTFDCTPTAFKLLDIGGGVLNIVYDQVYIPDTSGSNSISIYDSSNTTYTGGPINIAYTITSAQSAFGILGRWLLATEDFGCQPAWDDGVFTLLDFDYGCQGLTNFYDIFNQQNWSLYISGKDSIGHDQSSYLAQAIGYGGTITFTQGASYVTLSFDDSNAEANNYSSTNGLMLNSTNTLITGWNIGTFNGFNNGGYSTNNLGGSNEQYYVQPLNTQLVEITINIVAPTPTPTPNPTQATPTPTPNPPTPTPTPTSPSSYSIGDLALGGVIAYILQPGDPGYNASVQHGLVASINDLGFATWANGSYIDVTGTSSALGSGSSNTDLIIAAQGSGYYGASLAKNYTGGSYNDWYLPSVDELLKLSQNQSIIGNFNDGYYYETSTQVDTTNAYYVSFLYGTNATSVTKLFGFPYIRPVRSF